MRNVSYKILPVSLYSHPSKACAPVLTPVQCLCTRTHARVKYVNVYTRGKSANLYSHPSKVHAPIVTPKDSLCTCSHTQAQPVHLYSHPSTTCATVLTPKHNLCTCTHTQAQPVYLYSNPYMYIRGIIAVATICFTLCSCSLLPYTS